MKNYIEIKNSSDEKWNNYYNLLVNYYNTYGNINVKRDFYTFDGITYDKDGIRLGYWLVRQKRLMRTNKLSNSRIKLLENLGIVWNTNNTWDDNYNMLLNYYNHYGDLKIPEDFRTNDGVNYAEDGILLRIWLYVQKLRYKRNILSLDKVNKLKLLGINLSNKSVKVYNIYNEKDKENELLNQYKDGNINVIERIIDIYYPLIKSTSLKYIDENDNEYEDIIHEGIVGLIEAINDYNDKNYTFYMMAHRYINKYIMNYIISKNNNYMFCYEIKK